jgi:1-acyl-sn-glycerol-3-phosphate acyltransferase
VVAGPPIDLSRWAGAQPTAATLTAITEEIMLRLRDMLAEVRGGTPPPLFVPSAKKSVEGLNGGLGEVPS